MKELTVKEKRLLGLEKAWKARADKSYEVNPIIKSRESLSSRATAIKAMCAHCMGCTEDHLEPNWKAEVKNCTAFKCPLHPFRDYQDKEKPYEV